jgi:hypothetical protein
LRTRAKVLAKQGSYINIKILENFSKLFSFFLITDFKKTLRQPVDDLPAGRIEIWLSSPKQKRGE